MNAKVDLGQYKPIGARPPMLEYIKGLWARRYFIQRESKAKAYGSIKDTALGTAWLILSPFLNAAVYYVIFGVLLGFSRSRAGFVGYLVVGVTFFQFLTNQFGGATNIITNGRNLIRAFSFPRASLVFSFTLRNLYDFLPTLYATILFIVIVPPHSLPYWTWLLFPLAFAIAIVFGLGLAFFTSTMTTLMPDLKFIWPVFTKFWFYGSGVIWTIEQFKGHHKVAEIMQINPGWQFLELCRELLVYNRLPHAWLWYSFTAWSLVTFIVGFILFWYNEEKFSNVK
ncbi:ABC transporter permease [Arcanobacterium canis]